MQSKLYRFHSSLNLSISWGITENHKISHKSNIYFYHFFLSFRILLKRILRVLSRIILLNRHADILFLPLLISTIKHGLCVQVSTFTLSLLSFFCWIHLSPQPVDVPGSPATLAASARAYKCFSTGALGHGNMKIYEGKMEKYEGKMKEYEGIKQKLRKYIGKMQKYPPSPITPASHLTGGKRAP